MYGHRDVSRGIPMTDIRIRVIPADIKKSLGYDYHLHCWNPKMMKVMTIGVLGGMGPQATNQLCARLTALTPAKSDQEHIPVITYNNPSIPSRMDAVSGTGPSPLPELIRSAKLLQDAGADFLVMPCNAAHFYLDQICAAVEIPMLNMIELAAQYLGERIKVSAVGLLATTATIETRLYADALERRGIQVIVPTQSEQKLVMKAIYGNSGVKAGFVELPSRILRASGDVLIERGAQAILAGCTEVSVALAEEKLDFELVDPMEIVASVAVQKALYGFHRIHGTHIAHAG